MLVVGYSFPLDIFISPKFFDIPRMHKTGLNSHLFCSFLSLIYPVIQNRTRFEGQDL